MQRVLALDPIGYWMQDEKSGVVSYDMVTARAGGARNGVYTGVTLGQPGIGDGRSTPFFDGANDYNDIFSVSFSNAFDGAEGSFAIWARVDAVGVWTDGSWRNLVDIRRDANNLISIAKSTANNRISFFYTAGGVAETFNADGLADIDFFHIVMTWSAVGDSVFYYKDGALLGSDAGLGAWVVGALDANRTLIGATTQAPAQVWEGTLAHAAVWDYALSPTQIADLVVIE
jgi:hypothetical protein